MEQAGNDHSSFRKAIFADPELSPGQEVLEAEGRAIYGDEWDALPERNKKVWRNVALLYRTMQAELAKRKTGPAGDAAPPVAEATEAAQTIGALRRELETAQRQLANARQDAQYAWENTRILNKAIGEEMARRDALTVALKEVRGCFAAALVEGLTERLAEEKQTDAGSLHDLIVRRLMPADNFAADALASLPGAPKDSTLGAPRAA